MEITSGMVTEEDVKRLSARAGRSCGKCSLCCLLPEIDGVPKKKLEWCEHARPGCGGCAIYDHRPDICRNYACSWLVGQLPDRWQPLKAKIISDFLPTPNGYIRRFLVHPHYVERWREKPWYDDILGFAKTGLENDPPYRTAIVIAQRFKWLVLPHGPIPYSPGIVTRKADGQWMLLRTDTDAQARVLEQRIMEQMRGLVQPHARPRRPADAAA